MPVASNEPVELLRLTGITKTYVMGEVDVPVLHGIDMTIHDGELTVILGPSGSGKTTLLNIIGGIDAPTDGQIQFDGSQLTQLNERQLTDYRRHNVGFVFQFYNLVPTLTARENVEVATEIATDPMNAGEALALVDMADRADHFPAQLSGGEQQRVAIARAVAKRPRLLLCDEPTGALDFTTGQVVLDVLDRLNRDMGATIVLITHVGPIADLAHRVVRLGSGLIVESRANEHRRSAQEITW